MECWADPSGEQTEQRPANSAQLWSQTMGTSRSSQPALSAAEMQSSARAQLPWHTNSSLLFFSFMLFKENQGQPETLLAPFVSSPSLQHHLNLTKKQCQHCAVGAGSCQNVLTKHPHVLQPCSPPRQRELSLNYTKQIGSIKISFLNGYIKIKMNGNCFSIRGDGRHSAEPTPGSSPYPCRTETPALRAQ